MTHSDLPNKGKRNGNKESIEKDYLYYLTVEQMTLLEKTQDKPFESAKQSNIAVPTIFFSALGIEQLQRRSGPQKTEHKHIVINDYADVYLVNENMKFFTSYYTRNILDKLGKHPNWYNDDLDVKLDNNSDFTPIKVTHAIHGIGTSDDIEFSKLRLNVFKNDILIILIESKPDFKKNVFILFDRNPIFYTILGEYNKSWYHYAEKKQRSIEIILKQNLINGTADDKTRAQQSRWRDLLAEEMMNYSTVDGEIFCPFTYLTCNYEQLGTLFRASHIKAFNKCLDASEAYDTNNGLLLCANADALFDKYLITVSEEKELMVSFLLKSNLRLMNNLLLNQPIFKLALNDKRMEYMRFHRQEFMKLEEIRKKK